MVSVSTFDILNLLQSNVDIDELFKTILPESAMIRAEKISNRKNRLLSLSGELLARYLLNKTFNLSLDETEFAYGHKGKPYIKHSSNIHFNISHSGTLVTAAVAQSRIGVDVEHYRKINFRIAERYFTPAELFYIHTQDEPEKTRTFFEVWTIKESFLKAIGTGLTRSLSSFEVSNNAGKFEISGKGSENFRVHAFSLPDYQLALCIENDSIPDNIAVVDAKELFGGIITGSAN